VRVRTCMFCKCTHDCCAPRLRQSAGSAEPELSAASVPYAQFDPSSERFQKYK
jgi:hypothetical protein